jgi:hypothetical protein
MAISWAAIVILLACGEQVEADIITYSSEPAFVSATMPLGPLDAPFSAVTNSVTVGGGLFTVTPGPGVPGIAVANVIGIGLPSSLVVDGMSLSNFNFAFGAPTTAFGVTVANATAPDFLPGTSVFDIALFNNTAQVGMASFVSPGSGNIFFGVQSSDPFNLLTLREVVGGPQNATPFGGFADREFFGRFYVTQAPVSEPNTPVPEPKTFALLGLGISCLLAYGWRNQRRAKGSRA